MERIVYRKTLDAHKNGIQFTLQGFETADNMARTIELSLMASGDAIDLPLEQLSAIMYVTTPNSTEPSINKCSIKDNTIIYDVLPITEEGITEMQLKLIETRPDGAKGVLMSPRFAIEVTKSNAEDESVTQSTTYTALENAIASAKAVYDKRMLRVEIDNDCVFSVVYADGSTYYSEALKETLLKGEAILSKSYARGDTGTRTGEDTDNSLYYSNVSKSASEDAQRVNNEAIELLDETRKHGVYTAFSIDFESGEVKYISPAYKFNINKANGNIEAVGQTYTPEQTIDMVVTEWLNQKGAVINDLNYRVDGVEDAYHNVTGTLQRLDNIVTNLQPKITDIENHIENLGDLRDEVGAIWESVYEAKEDVNNFVSMVDTVETNVDSLDETLTEFKNNTEANQSTVNEELTKLNNQFNSYRVGNKIQIGETMVMVDEKIEKKPVYRQTYAFPSQVPTSETIGEFVHTEFALRSRFAEVYSFNACMVKDDKTIVYPLPYFDDNGIQTFIRSVEPEKIEVVNRANWSGYHLEIEIVYS